MIDRKQREENEIEREIGELIRKDRSLEDTRINQTVYDQDTRQIEDGSTGVNHDVRKLIFVTKRLVLTPPVPKINAVQADGTDA